MTTKFQKGQSGNPAGKKPGTKDKRTELRQLLQPHAANLLQKAVDMALSGDQAALRMCLDRIVPTVKSVSETVTIALPSNGTLAEQGQALFQAAATGKINAEEASRLMSILAGQIRILEATDLDARIQALEAQAKIRGGTI
jgi:hypothetical protein